LKVLSGHALFLVDHADKALDLKDFLHALRRLEVNCVLGTYISVALRLLGFYGLSIVLEIHTIPWVLLGIPLVQRLLGLFLVFTIA